MISDILIYLRIDLSAYVLCTHFSSRMIFQKEYLLLLTNCKQNPPCLACTYWSPGVLDVQTMSLLRMLRRTIHFFDRIDIQPRL